jgi:nucleoside permease NupC
MEIVTIQKLKNGSKESSLVWRKQCPYMPRREMIEFVLFSLTGAAMLLITAYMFLEYCEK